MDFIGSRDRSDINMSKNFEFFKPNEDRLIWRLKEIQAFRTVLKSTNYIKGEQNRLFEAKFTEYIGCNHVLAVNSGTDALIIGLLSIGVVSGDEIIVPSHTATATISAVLAVGGTPIFVDINPEYFTIDIEGVERAITSKTKAIVAVHIYGQSCDLANLQRLCKEKGIHLVEDCAQATGAEYHGRKVGSFGDIAAFSFYPTKNLGAAGDAGALAIKNKIHFEFARKIAQYGWNRDRVSEINGINSRMDEVQASILVRKIRYIEKWNAKRNQLANIYLKNLDSAKYVLPTIRENCTHVFHLFVVKSDKRDEVMTICSKKKIPLGIHYRVPNHLHPSFQKYSKENQLKITEKIANTIISLPLYPEMPRKNVLRVCEVLNEI